MFLKNKNLVDERRMRLLVIRNRVLLKAFRDAVVGDGYEPVFVGYDDREGCIVFGVTHETFEPVPQGTDLPIGELSDVGFEIRSPLNVLLDRESPRHLARYEAALTLRFIKDGFLPVDCCFRLRRDWTRAEVDARRRRRTDQFLRQSPGRRARYKAAVTARLAVDGILPRILSGDTTDTRFVRPDSPEAVSRNVANRKGDVTEKPDRSAEHDYDNGANRLAQELE